MRILVTGGAGFIGSHLCERLHADGHEVLVVDSYASGADRARILEGLGIKIEVLDIRQERLRSVVEAFRPESIVHLAAQASVSQSVADPLLDAKVNIVGMLRLLESARDVGSRVIFASSGGTIYGEPSDSPLKEGALGPPSSPYGISKKVAEDYLRFYQGAYRLHFVSLAIGNVYGPRQDPHGEAGVVAIFARKLVAGEPCVIYGDGKQTRDFVFVSDVVDAFVAALERGEGETVNVASGIETTINDVYRKLASIAGVDAEPNYEGERPGDLRRNWLDIAKAADVLGWKPKVSFEEGLRLTFEYFSEKSD